MLQRIASTLSKLSYRHPLIVVSFATLAAVAGAYLYFFDLEVLTDRNQLIDKELATNRFAKAYHEEFGEDELLVLVVTATEPGAIKSLPTQRQRQQMKLVAERWARALRKHPDVFPKITERINWEEWKSLALLYLPYKDVEQIAGRIRTRTPSLIKLAESPTIENSMGVLNTEVKNFVPDSTQIGQSQMSDALDGLTDFFSSVSRQISEKTPADNNKLNELELSSIFTGLLDRDGFFFVDGGRVLIAFANVLGNQNERNRYARVMHLAQLAVDNGLGPVDPSLKLAAGLAGMPALEFEEIKTAQMDFSRSAIFALLFITLLFTLSFGSIIRSVLAAFTLCLAIGMTFAFTWLVVGHLNVLAMIFTVILVALGIDFAIHFLTHYEQALDCGKSPEVAIQLTHDSIGGALVMGGTTTAAAFLSAYFTEFVGLSELGLIAGAGLLLCFFCTTIVYPALLYLLDIRFLKSKKFKMPQTALSKIPVGISGYFSSKTRRPILGVALLLVCLGYISGQYHFDSNLLNLQALDSKANYWQQVLLATEDRSLFAISTFDDRASLADAQVRYHAMPELVRHTEALYPAQEVEKRRILQPVCKDLTMIQGKDGKSSLFGLKRQIWNLRQTLRRYANANSDAKQALTPVLSELNRLYALITDSPSEEVVRSVADLDSQIESVMQELTRELTSLLCPPELEFEQIPGILQDRFLGKHGTLALFIYPRANIWEQHNLEKFVAGVRSVDPNVIGQAISLHENGQSLYRSFLQASLYSLIAILVLLLLWFRSVSSTLLALIPLVTSVGALLGVMKWLPGEIPWNFTNFFALPILIGIGVDSGIHLVQARKDQRQDTLQGAVKAVFLSTITTMVGFGILATSTHLGVASLGLVLFIGISFCLLAALTVLPAAFAFFPEKKSAQL